MSKIFWVREDTRTEIVDRVKHGDAANVDDAFRLLFELPRVDDPNQSTGFSDDPSNIGSLYSLTVSDEVHTHVATRLGDNQTIDEYVRGELGLAPPDTDREEPVDFDTADS